MPITASVKKSLRVSLRKAAINRRRKLLIKAALKNVTASNLPKAISLVDRGAKWGIFHPNKAARLKSKLMRSSFVAKPEVEKKPTKKVALAKTSATPSGAPSKSKSAQKKTVTKKRPATKSKPESKK